MHYIELCCPDLIAVFCGLNSLFFVPHFQVRSLRQSDEYSAGEITPKRAAHR